MPVVPINLQACCDLSCHSQATSASPVWLCCARQYNMEVNNTFYLTSSLCSGGDGLRKFRMSQMLSTIWVHFQWLIKSKPQQTKAVNFLPFWRELMESKTAKSFLQCISSVFSCRREGLGQNTVSSWLQPGRHYGWQHNPHLPSWLKSPVKTQRNWHHWTSLKYAANISWNIQREIYAHHLFQSMYNNSFNVIH